MKRILVCILVLVVVLTGGLAQAEMKHGKGEHGVKGIIKHADANGDGNITYQEFMQAKWKYFDYKFVQLDANDDGVVSHREFMEYHRTKGDALFKKADKDGNGVISAEEKAQCKMLREKKPGAGGCKKKPQP